jgi:hypothetical protein
MNPVKSMMELKIIFFICVLFVFICHMESPIKFISIADESRNGLFHDIQFIFLVNNAE